VGERERAHQHGEWERQLRDRAEWEREREPSENQERAHQHGEWERQLRDRAEWERERERQLRDRAEWERERAKVRSKRERTSISVMPARNCGTASAAAAAGDAAASSGGSTRSPRWWGGEGWHERGSSVRACTAVRWAVSNVRASLSTSARCEGATAATLCVCVQ
jgi:hypothetical protein